MAYADEGVPLVVLAGKEYGSGSSRDWAAKGTALLGVRAVIAESFERIHRSNLIGMGVLPLQLPDGETRAVARTRRARRRSRSATSRTARRRRSTVTRHAATGCATPVDASRRGSASTRRTRSATSKTAASCTACCATCAEPHERPRSGLTPARGMSHDERDPREGRSLQTRPRPVPPPGAIASASLPGYRRAGGGAGRVDPLPPAAPPRQLPPPPRRLSGSRIRDGCTFRPPIGRVRRMP